MAKCKREELITDAENLHEGCSVPEEDKVISLEGITGTEKKFLNFIRKFRCQGWLREHLGELIDETWTDMMDKSVEDMALQESIEDFHAQQLDIEDMYIHYQKKIEEVSNREDFISEIASFWEEQISGTVNGELIPVEEC